MSRAFALHGADRLKAPVLISVPHAGRDYPAALISNLRASPASLLRLEDRYADLLAKPALEQGFATIIARFPRAWIDLNRDPGEIDPDMIHDAPRMAFGQPSAKVRGGLGLVPGRLSGIGNLWRNRWSMDDIRSRLAEAHEPYHAMVARLLERMRAQFGAALLLDLHSMPSLPLERGEEPVRIVLGDRFGRSCASQLSEAARRFLAGTGERTSVNFPYAGGHMLERHGRPVQGVHALQIEIDRSLYLDSDQREPGAAVHQVAAHIAGLAEYLSDELLRGTTLMAAE